VGTLERLKDIFRPNRLGDAALPEMRKIFYEARHGGGCRRHDRDPAGPPGLPLPALHQVVSGHPARAEGKPAVEPDTATRRHYVRVPVEFPARLWTSQSKYPHTGVVKEITMGGCSLDVDVALTQGSELRIELSLSETEPPVMIQKATVCSVRPNGFGLQFTDLQPDEKTRLGRIMEELLTAAIVDCQKAVSQ
jgi:hypothetical protein